MTDPHRGRHWLLVAFVVACALGSYAGHADMYFVKDDFNIVLLTDDEGAFSATEWWGQFIWPTERTWDDIWRPVPAITWAAEYLVFGADPLALHLGQLLLHALCCVALYWLVNRLTWFRDPLAGFFAACLFAVYPSHPEAVLWLTQRTVLMGLLFSFVAMILFDRWLHEGGRRYFVLAFLCVALGTLSREHALPLPAVFCVQALFYGPPRSFMSRVRQIVSVIVVYVAFVASYFGCRYLIWGRLTGPYSGYSTNQAYAEANQVWERFWNETIMSGVVPGNWHWFNEPVGWSALGTWYGLVTWVLAGFAAVALVRLALSLSKPRGSLGFVAVALTFTVVSWLPVHEVFWVNRYLLNSRSWYHLIAFLVALMAVGLVNPWRADRGGALRVALPVSLLLIYGAMLQVNLRSRSGGDAQVRGLQSALVDASTASGPDAMHVVLHSPQEYYGCTTVSAYLPTMMGPPFVQPRVPCFPLLSEDRASWARSLFDPTLPVRRWANQGRPLRFHVATGGPTALRPVFGAKEGPQGDRPPIPVFPADGEVVAVGAGGSTLLPRGGSGWRPDGRAAVLQVDGLLSPATEGGGVPVTVCDDLAVVFDAHRSAERFVVHLLAPPDKHFQFPVAAGSGATVLSSDEASGRRRLAVALSGLTFQGVPLWPPLPGSFPGYLPVMWRVEALEASGRASGLSPSTNLLVIEGRRSAP